MKQKIDTVFDFNVRMLATSKDYGTLRLVGTYKAGWEEASWTEDIDLQYCSPVNTDLIPIFEFVLDQWEGKLKEFQEWLYEQISEHCNRYFVDDEDYDQWINAQLIGP